jgi:hypothetical protein
MTSNKCNYAIRLMTSKPFSFQNNKRPVPKYNQNSLIEICTLKIFLQLEIKYNE